LTTKEACKNFPTWTDLHQTAFKAIKTLVVSHKCFTVIDHHKMSENKVFITCDASDWRTGATLSFGPMWELARLVAFNSMQLKGPEKNYPVHEKELLAIIHALKKWWADLLGIPIYIYMDHWTLQNFDTQRDLSRQQLRWQEFLLQYDMTMIYIPGEDNTVADVLFRVCDRAFPGETVGSVPVHGIDTMLSITTNPSILCGIQDGYLEDEFCKKVMDPVFHMKGISSTNGLWYIGDCLIVPRVNNICKQLFHLAHDTSGHFGADKSYAALHDTYYWPNMRHDRKKSYIPPCLECLHNKSTPFSPYIR
jgi:hypothetical protein